MNAKTCYICGREFVPTAFNQRRCPEDYKNKLEHRRHQMRNNKPTDSG